MQRRPPHGGKQRGSIYSAPGESSRRQQEQHGISQPSHSCQNPRKRPHSPLSVTTTPLDDEFEFDEIGSAALSDYELSQHPGTKTTAAQPQAHVSHPPVPAHQPSTNFPAPATLQYNPYTASSSGSRTSTSSSGGGTSTSSSSEQLPISSVPGVPAHSTASVGAGDTRIQGGVTDNQEWSTQLENMRYRFEGEVKTLRDRISQEERVRKEGEQKLHSLKEAHKLEQASKEEEWKRKYESLSTQLMFARKEAADEREKREATEERLSLLGGVSPAEQVVHVPAQVMKVKRPRSQCSSANTSPSTFPSTASFMESPRLLASTPVQRKRSGAMHPPLPYVDSKRGVTADPTHCVTPNPSPLLAARGVNKSVQTPIQSSSSLLSISSSSSVQVGRTFIFPLSEGDALVVDDVQSDGRFSGPELLQRLVQLDRQENKLAIDGQGVSSQDKLALLSEDDTLSPSTEDEEDAEQGDTSNSPPAQPDGVFSLLTCLNPFFIASTSKPTDALMSPQHSSSSSSKRSKAVIKQTSLLVKAAILQSIGRKRSLAASEDSESSSSDDSGPAKSVGNMSPFLLDAASQCQLQECVTRLLASTGVPHTTQFELCTPLNFAEHRDAFSTAQLHGEEDQGLSLLYFLQARIIAYYQECIGDSSRQVDDEDSPFDLESPESVDSLAAVAGSDRGIGSSSLSTESGVVDFCAPLLQLLKTLLVLVQYSPRVREKICERPPRLVYDSLIPSRPESRESGRIDSQSQSQSESLSSGSKDGSMELLGPKLSQDLSDQSSGRMDSSGSQSQLSQLGLVEADLPIPQEHVWVPHPSLSKVRIDLSSHSGTASNSNQPSFSLSEQEVSVDVMHHASLTAQFFPLLLRLAGPPWSDNLPICQCVLDILSHLVPTCSPDLRRRLLILLSGEMFAAYLKHNSCDVAYAMARIATALVPTKGMAELLCSKRKTTCLLHKLYMFLCDPPSDSSEVAIAELTSQVLRLMCAVVSHIDGGFDLIFYSECKCSFEALRAIQQGICRHLPIRNGTQVPQPIITFFQEFVSFLDCWDFRLVQVGRTRVDYIFAIENLLEFFSGLGKEHTREVTVLKNLQQNMEQHEEGLEQGEESMDTQSL